MSKNVAVFVDVANIFYAAKAAGVDIDYVTLLKSAIAGRDFVRAYAYTGLDPENENQRQFHSFLARNGYKVVSKDIRKYGDGRIKANLDIELVVDLMRLARNLDIAVVVSGDGDFAPAIRAVQQMGVRVEVVSFRGNTSSDLIEVADSFTDIAQVARVEKGSARSGRRVAAEGDLSMTAVPEKETEGMPRRQRGRRGERQPVASAADTGNLIVLPGERLSRAPDAEEELPGAEVPQLEVVEGDGEEGALAAGQELSEEARRRRRRRGGRGRGRGRRAEVDVLPGEEAPAEEEEEEEFEEMAPAPLPQHTFGSVWDSQLGVPTAPVVSSAETYGGGEEDEEDLEEPEIPEYLLAERRQRGQRGQRGRMGGGRGGRGSGYQAALDRERYGRSGMGGGGFGGSRTMERQRPERGRGGRPGRQGGRPDRQPQRQRSERGGPPAGASASGAPWSEVPPELEELLRAELARKGGQPDVAPVTSQQAAEADEPAEAAPKRTTRRRSTSAGEPDTETTPEPAAEAAPEAEETPKRATRRRTPRASQATAEVTPEGATEAPTEAEEKPKRTTRRRTTKAAETAPAGEQQAAQPEGEETEAPKRTTRRRTPKATDEATED